MKYEVKSQNNQKAFAKGIFFYKLFWLFMLTSCLGTYYEEILNLIKTYNASGEWIYVVRRGVFYGPFSPVYGIGAVFFIVILGRNKRPLVKTFLYSTLLGGSFEYIISFLQEFFLGTTSWNYKNQFLSINGRTTIPIMLGWGLLGVVLIHFIYPYISKFLESLPSKPAKIITIIAVVFMSLNIFISWGALIRQTLRRNEIKPITPLGEYFDKTFPDERIKQVFNNMKERK